MFLSACGSTEPERSAPADAPPTNEPQAAERVVAAVAWPEASTIDVSALGRLSEASRRVVERAPVPALVVSDDVLLANAVVMAQPSWYAVSTRGDGITVSLHASKVAHRYPHIPPLERPTGKKVRGHDAIVTENEAIWSAAWIEGGVAYSLEVECARLPDPRCESDAFVMGLAGRLAFVGGEGVAK